MKWSVVGTDADVWDRALARLPHTDVYFLPGYHRAHEVNGDGTALAFVAEADGELMLYPFMRRTIPGHDQWCDLETVYGYSGPLATTTDAEFLTEAWAAFADWCDANHVVAEFLRFHPLLENVTIADAGYTVTVDRETVHLDLSGTEDDLWTHYPSVQRNMVRKAAKNGLTAAVVDVATSIDEFRTIYERTMSRLDAADFYYFGDEYYATITDALADHLQLVAVRDGDRTVAAALFFAYGRQLHYHLAGSDYDYIKLAPNNLLIHTAAVWGQANGFTDMHLGGGRTPAPDDNLLRFKKRISATSVPFHTGRRVRHQDTYDELCAAWMERSGRDQRPNYFLLYRMPFD